MTLCLDFGLFNLIFINVTIRNIHRDVAYAKTGKFCGNVQQKPSLDHIEVSTKRNILRTLRARQIQRIVDHVEMM